MPEASLIRIRCPVLTCQRVLAVPANARGKLVICKGCRSKVRIPAARGEAIPAASSESHSGEQA